MKKLIYLLLLPLALAVAACGGKMLTGCSVCKVQKLKLILSLREETIIRWFRVLLTKVCLTSLMRWGIRM